MTSNHKAIQIRPKRAEFAASHHSWLKQDPYAVVSIGGSHFKTGVARKEDTHPHWDDVFTVSMPLNRRVHLSIYDEESLRSDYLLGEASFSLNEIALSQGSVQRRFTLTHNGKVVGEVCMEFGTCDGAAVLSEPMKEEPHHAHQGGFLARFKETVEHGTEFVSEKMHNIARLPTPFVDKPLVNRSTTMDHPVMSNPSGPQSKPTACQAKQPSAQDEEAVQTPTDLIFGDMAQHVVRQASNQSPSSPGKMSRDVAAKNCEDLKHEDAIASKFEEEAIMEDDNEFEQQFENEISKQAKQSMPSLEEPITGQAEGASPTIESQELCDQKIQQAINENITSDLKEESTTGSKKIVGTHLATGTVEKEFLDKGETHTKVERLF